MNQSLLTTISLCILFWVISLIIRKKSSVSSKTRLKDGWDFVSQLDKLEYFKYTESGRIKIVKEAMVLAYDPASSLEMVWDDVADTPYDYRLYYYDGEGLFEAGGFTYTLEKLKPTFDIIGLKLIITNHVEEWDTKNNWLNHTITINGNHYTIFKNFTGQGWGEATQTFADIINNELSLQNKEDRIYLINSGNEGRLIFLNPAQFKYIDSVLRDKQWKPLKVDDWCKEMNVKPQKINSL